MKKKRTVKADAQLRQSQLVTTFGPGAPIDLPRHSVLIGGLEHWTKGDRIVEHRLEHKVSQQFGGASIALHAPPAPSETFDAVTGVRAFLFPQWFLTVSTKPAGDGRWRSRQLVPLRNLERGQYRDEESLKHEVVPVRFVRACVRGHLDDLDWAGFTHDYKQCPRGTASLSLEERGTSGDVGEIVVRCVCGAQRRIQDATVSKSHVLGDCTGGRPWLGRGTNEACTEKFRLLVRTASNAYFAQILSVISLPDPQQLLNDRIDSVWSEIEGADSADEIAFFRRKQAKVASALTGFSDAEVWERLAQRKSGAATERKVKEVEFDALARSEDEIGEDRPSGNFFARAVPRPKLRGKNTETLERVVLVHRLREVRAITGFTRFESASPDLQGDLDVGVLRADIARETTWVPAVETRGEGVFLHFKASAIAAWCKRPAVVRRAEQLMAGVEAWNKTRKQGKRVFCGMPYLLLHSLSHLLITTVSLRCGYPASSIRERIYALPDQGYGILLYTATSDSEGTLGGLVEVGRNIGAHLDEAIDLGRLCSNDPVCAQHDAKDEHEQRFLQGAACHGCLLISETSCEMRNDFLDRAVVVPTVDGNTAAFFED